MTSRLTPVQAMSMALDLAATRGHAGDPVATLQCLPDGWGLVETRSVAEAIVADLIVTHAVDSAVVGMVDGEGNVHYGVLGAWDVLPEQALVPEQRLGLGHVLVEGHDAATCPHCAMPGVSVEP